MEEFILPFDDLRFVIGLVMPLLLSYYFFSISALFVIVIVLLVELTLSFIFAALLYLLSFLLLFGADIFESRVFRNNLSISVR